MCELPTCRESDAVSDSFGVDTLRLCVHLVEFSARSCPTRANSCPARANSGGKTSSDVSPVSRIDKLVVVPYSRKLERE